MAKQNKTTLKNYFQTGDIPSQAQYAHLIDSQLNLAETGTQIASGNISASNFIAQNDVTASGNISSSGEIIASKVNVITDGSPTADGYYINSTQFISGSTVGTLEFGDFDSDGTRIKITDNSNRIELSNDNPNTTKIFLDGEITASGNISSSGNVIANTVNTGQGNNELYAMNQDVQTTDNVTFANITSSGNISASGDLSIQGFSSVSASIANLVAGGTDNLGNHIATQDLDLADNSIKNILHVTASIISASTYFGTMPTASTVTVDLNDSINIGVIPVISNTAVSQSALISPQISMFYDQEGLTFGDTVAKLRVGQSNPIDRPGVLELFGGGGSKSYITTFNANLQISPASNSDLILSASGTGDITLEGNVTQSGGTVKIDYDSLPTSDPNNKGQIYRNGSNALFVSAG